MKAKALLVSIICGVIFTGCSSREVSINRYNTSSQNTTYSTAGYTKRSSNILIESSEVSYTSKKIDVPIICQYPELPTGCESTAAVMVLQYYGVDITATRFAQEWLECDDSFYWLDNVLYGPDPDEVFAGTPFSKSSYGCFATPIVNAVNDNSLDCTAEKITDMSLEELCTEYINNNKPILIWATMGMKESQKGRSWILPDGSEYNWIAGEHCLVLLGYDEDYYFLNDPQTGELSSYKKELVENRFEELGSQAVYINRNDY